MNLVFLFTCFAFCFGCIVGSFLNVVVWRLPRGESLCHPGSHCPKCGHAIRAWENIPILSWLCLRGKCSACKLPISWRYPAGEGAVGLLYAGIFYHTVIVDGCWQALPGHFWLAGSLLSAALIDAEHRIIPNKITYSGILAAAVFALLFPLPWLHIIANFQPIILDHLIFFCLGNFIDPQFSLNTALNAPHFASLADYATGLGVGLAIPGLFAAVGNRIMQKFKPGIQLLGWGDVKLLGMIGAFLGADAVIYILLEGAFLGFAAGLIKLFSSKKKGDVFTALPFGPFLATAALLWLLFGNLLRMYFNNFIL